MSRFTNLAAGARAASASVDSLVPCSSCSRARFAIGSLCRPIICTSCKPQRSGGRGALAALQKALSELVHFAGAQSPSRVAQNERHDGAHTRGGALGAAAALDLPQLQL